MRLLFAILRLVTRKAVAVAVVVATLVLVTLAWNWVRDQTRASNQVAAAQARVGLAFDDWRARRADLLKLEQQLTALRKEEPSWLRPVDRLTWQARVAALESAVATTQAARDEAHAAWQTARNELAQLQARVDKMWTGLLAAARGTWWQMVMLAALVLVGPALWKAFWFYVLAALASGRPPARIGRSDTSGTLTDGPRGKCLEVEVAPDRPLVARMDWVQQYAPRLAKQTRFLFAWRSPFTSFAAGLAEMTELTARPGEPTGRVLLNAGSDPNAYILALELDQHPGLVLRPGAVVGVTGSIHLRPRWHLGSLHHWIAGRVRHILFCGTGVVYVSGVGGVEVSALDQDVVIEEALVLGYDSRAAFATVRTETFWPYFRGKTSLFDYRFAGGHAAIRQTTAPTTARQGNPFVRTVDALLNGIGKLLGF